MFKKGKDRVKNEPYYGKSFTSNYKHIDSSKRC